VTIDWVMLAAITVGEVFLLLFILLFISWFASRSKGNSDKAAIKIFINRVNKSKAQREENIREHLSDIGIIGDVLDLLTKSILKKEMRFYKRFANIYQSRNAEAAAMFHKDVQSLISLYWQHMAEREVSPHSQQEQVGNFDASEFERLNEENARLSEELRVTMNTMARMLNEYSSMFVTPEGEAALQEDHPVEEPEETPESTQSEQEQSLPEAVESAAEAEEDEKKTETELDSEVILMDDTDIDALFDQDDADVEVVEVDAKQPG